MMAAIGTGNIEEGRVTMSLGTSSTVYSFSSRPVIDRSGLIAPFCSSTGGWLPLVCTMNATGVVTQTLDLLGKNVSDIDPALQSTPPGADGMVVLPFLNGERTPDLPRAKAIFAGISSTNFKSSNLIRAVIEGVSFGVLRGLEQILQGRQASVIYLTGGGARSPQWRQLLADATGAVIELPAEEETGCLGAAIQAMYCASHTLGQGESFASLTQRCVKADSRSTTYPRPEFREAYRQAMDQYVDLLNREYPRIDSRNSYSAIENLLSPRQCFWKMSACSSRIPANSSFRGVLLPPDNRSESRHPHKPARLARPSHILPALDMRS